MALDYQAVRNQVKRLGENASSRERELQERRDKAWHLFGSYAQDLEGLRKKVELVARSYEPNLRCAVPVDEPLNAHFPQPALPGRATIMAADGSQITPDRHAPVEFCLINTGAIEMCLGSPEPPHPTVHSKLLYDDEMLSSGGSILSDAAVGAKRDLSEREILVELAEQARPPLITFTDGPIELWGGSDATGTADFQKSLDAYLDILSRLYELGAATAGYVDKPGANLVVRLLEVMMTPEDRLSNFRREHPLRGVSDSWLFREILAPGERSAVFAMQSYSIKHYTGPLAVHFFYLNVGRPTHPWIARVEAPAWVAGSPEMLDQLHAVLVAQCQIMGTRPYPYLLHRAHEAALVSLQEKEQVTQMIMIELRRRGVAVGEASYKQANKDLPGRTSFDRH
jgi:hypothetical protein